MLGDGKDKENVVQAPSSRHPASTWASVLTLKVSTIATTTPAPGSDGHGPQRFLGATPQSHPITSVQKKQ